MTDDCMGCRVPGYSHAAYCPEGRVEELRSRLAHAEACLAEKHLRLTEAEALLDEVLFYTLQFAAKDATARNVYERIKAFRASDSESEGCPDGGTHAWFTHVGGTRRHCKKCGAADQPPAAMSAEERYRMLCAWKGGGPCLADDCPRRATHQPELTVDSPTANGG